MCANVAIDGLFHFRAFRALRERAVAALQASSFISISVPIGLLVLLGYKQMSTMQTGSRSEPVKESLGKPILLGLITALVIGVVAPLIMPHIVHPSMIYHIILHVASLTVAIFLGVVSILAYARTASGRLLFMTLGFIALAGVEFLYLLDATWPGSVFNISALGIELPHVILLVMLALFSLGVLRVSK
jgi:hypothetical protein